MNDNLVSEERKQELLSQIKADTGPIIDLDKLQNIRYGDLRLDRRFVESKCAWTVQTNTLGKILNRSM